MDSPNDKTTSKDENILQMFAALPDVTGDAASNRRLCELACATAGMETRFHFLIAPQDHSRPVPCVVVPVGFEPGSGVSPSAWANKTTRDWLLTNKLVGNVSSANPSKMGWHPRVLAAQPLGKLIAMMFEDTLRYQLFGMVNHFSYGCTQRHLMYSGSEMGGSGKNGSLPQTWSELRDWYQNQTRAGLIERLKTHYKTYPGESDQEYINWLVQYQVGGGISKSTGDLLAKQYFYGTGGWAASSGGWKAKIAYVRMLTSKQ